MKNSENDSREFNSALTDFSFDVACGAAIRHLADLEFTVLEIRKRLSFPVSERQIGQAVWKHYVDKGIILTKTPEDCVNEKKITYIACKGEYGRTYFKQITKEQPVYYPNDYVKCDFGKLLYKDKDAFIKKIVALEKRDQDYLLSIPWPLQQVWHLKNDRFLRIMKSGVVCYESNGPSTFSTGEN